MPEERLITLNEAAAISGFSRSHLELLARKGRIRAQKMGPIWITTAEAVAEYANSPEKRSKDPQKYKRN